MKPGARQTYLSVLERLGSPKISVYSLILLAVLTFAGTLYQVQHGLFEAQKIFYNSWFILIGNVIPFPGAQLVMAVLFANLVAYFILKIIKPGMRWGLMILHAGILMMLAGGFYTHHYAEESFLSLIEGEGANVSVAYHEWELSVWKDRGHTRRVEAADTAGLQPGDTLAFADGRLRMVVDAYYENCKAFQSGAEPGNAPFNPSGIQRLEWQPKAKEPEANRPGAIFRVYTDTFDGHSVLFLGAEPHAFQLEVDGEMYQMALRRKRFPLPVYVQLTDFEKLVYPGTDTPKGFKSEVKVKMQDIERAVSISMNQPFRYMGYTLFQSSYSERGNVQSSTFSVVRNHGRLMPYIATGVTVLGMIWHFVAMMPWKTRRRNEART